MTLAEYQQLALRTYREELDRDMVITKGALCIAGEAGELANAVKKMLWHGHGVDGVKIMDECGDILWYLTTTLHGLGFTLEQAAQYNIAKLKKRYPEGFSEERSINREEDNTI